LISTESGPAPGIRGVCIRRTQILMKADENAGSSDPAFSYPERPDLRSNWVISSRQGLERRPHQVGRPAAVWVEDERQADGSLAPGLTVLLVNRECPWRCVMCDLWTQSTLHPVSIDDLLMQMDYALAATDRRDLKWIKLYNAGSFFDRGAIPEAAYAGIANRCHRFERVIVESHPLLVGPSAERFRAGLRSGTTLEVAMGLETVDPVAHAKLNKRTTPDDFQRSAKWLISRGMGVRAFVLARPPFIEEARAKKWLFRTVEFALEWGADPVVIIPTRLGNGAMERLHASGDFEMPPLAWVEEAMLHGIRIRKGRVFGDTWDLNSYAADGMDLEGWRRRVEGLNRHQAESSVS